MSAMFDLAKANQKKDLKLEPIHGLAGQALSKSKVRIEQLQHHIELKAAGGT